MSTDPTDNDKQTRSRSVLNRLGEWISPKRPKVSEEESGTDRPEASSPPAATEPPPPPAAAAGSGESNGDAPTPRPASSKRRRRPSRRGRKPAGKDKAQTNAGEQAAPAGQPDAAPASVADTEPPSQKADASADKPKAKSSKGSGRSKGKGKSKGGGKQKAAEGKTDKESATTLKLLINADEPEECRIVLLENGKVEAFHVETVGYSQSKGNIYKGRVTAVEPSLQAAFVDIGTGKNGFLPLNDIHPEYYCKEVPAETHWKDINIQDVIRKGQEMLVEVVKEATGNKGANLTTYLSMPGRYLVLMPGSDSAGISRKIEDEGQRQRLREMINGLKIPEGIGYIVRTASKEITKTAISQDVKYLLNLWSEIKSRGQKDPSPSLIYKEQNIISRFLRDHFTPDIQEIVVDTQEALDQVNTFLDLLPAKQKKTKARLHQGSRPLFNQYQVEDQIEQIYHPTVTLPSGGSIVINPTEALVAIDVNSGRTAKDKNFAETIFLANMEAAEELARQLRLRDLGGLIVVDFIDMRDSRHIREVEKKLKTSMKRDKAKVDFSRISKFGLMQISRQKMASPVQQGSYRICEYCQGRGMVRSVEAQALVYLRQIQTGVTRKNTVKVECQLPLDAARYLLNKKKEELLELERRYNVEIAIIPDPGLKPSEQRIEFLKG